MDTIKAGLVGATSLVIGIVTLRTLRQRRATPTEKPEDAVEEAVAETETAAEHIAAAAQHARAALEMTLEDAREDIDVEVPIESPRDEAASTEKSGSRFRTVGRELIRR